MKIDYLLKREDFYTILENTLNRYYSDILKLDNSVSVVEKKTSIPIVIYPRINRIIRRMPSIEVKKNIYRSYNINDSKIKNILVKIYIFLLLHSYGLLSSKCLKMTVPGLFPEYYDISPGNKKIRINDRRNLQSVIVVKDGFSDLYFQKELEFRKTQSSRNLVPIIEYGDGWYREPIIQGTPLARISNRARYDKCLQTAIEFISVVISDSIKKVSGKEYATKLCTCILENVNLVFSKKDDVLFTKRDVINILELLSERVRKIESVPIATSHGDLQDGNIYVSDRDEVFIIDWETFDNRSVWYDAVTLFLKIRRYKKWGRIIENYKDNSLLQKIKYFDTLSHADSLDCISVTLLEDLEFRLVDSLMIPGHHGCDSLNSFIEDIKGVLNNDNIQWN